jgi:hypothetical protein
MAEQSHQHHTGIHDIQDHFCMDQHSQRTLMTSEALEDHKESAWRQNQLMLDSTRLQSASDAPPNQT